MSPSEPPDRSTAGTRPARIILPGADPERSGTESAPRIVLPPGVAREGAPDDLPEYPRLRPLILMPVNDGERELLVVTDPLGVIQGQPVLSLEALPLLQMLDGSISLADLTAALMRESKDLRMVNVVRDFVADLDRMLMLDSPRFEAAYHELRNAWHQLEIRPAVCEARSYPAEPAELATFLEGHFEAAAALRTAAGEPEAPSDARPRALMVPHLDPRRAGPTIARAFLELGATPKQPLRVVVFGTGHALLDDLYALTRKHFETPLGKVTCDTAFVDALAARLGEAAWHGELAHRVPARRAAVHDRPDPVRRLPRAARWRAHATRGTGVRSADHRGARDRGRPGRHDRLSRRRGFLARRPALRRPGDRRAHAGGDLEARPRGDRRRAGG